jgi:peptidoglycan/xylan/chitin deacetylase (PgdA/CDA1 family)
VSGKPLASVSLDLDNQWSYMKTHGDAGWEAFPSYLDVFVPHALDVLDGLGLRITFFIVGQDAALERNHDALRAIVERGHEVGNHSFHHEQGIEGFSRERIRREVLETAEAVARATGREPKGYRGPGFSWNRALLETLVEAGYLYDASTLPTYLGPLARLYYFRKASLDRKEMEERKDLFGGFRDGFRPVKPYRWDLGAGKTLLEIPVTTVPGLKTPFHLSYLLYLSRYSTRLMAAYLDTALRLCRATGTEPSFLLHPLDLLGPEQAPALAFFPGMDVSAARKREVFTRVLGELGRRFTLADMSTHAREILRRDPPLREVDARAERAA